MQEFFIISFMFIGIFGFIFYKFLSLPVVTNLLYIKYGGDVAKEISKLVAEAVTNKQLPDNITYAVNEHGK